MTGSRRMFLSFGQAEELKSLGVMELREYFIERTEISISHGTWLELYRINFPRRKYDKVSRFGVSLKDVQQLMEALRGITVHSPSACAGLDPIGVQGRIEDFCQLKIVDQVSTAQAIEFATRKPGTPISKWSHLRSVVARYDESVKPNYPIGSCHCSMERRSNSNIPHYLSDRADIHGWG